MRAPTSRGSSFRYFSPFAMVHCNFSHVVRISPIMASTTVLPDSRTATLARVRRERGETFRTG